MGVKTLNNFFYKLFYGDKGADKATLVNDCLDVADAQIEANKNRFVSCSDYAHPDDAITAIGANNKTLLVTEAETCDTNFTVPANVTVRFERGGKWTINNGITVTFNGQLQAGLWQIFAYTGTGTLAGTIPIAYPQWWGALGDGVNNDSTAIQEAINRSKHTILPYTSAGYRSATQMNIGEYQVLDCYANIDVDVPAEDAFLTVTNSSRSQLRFYRKVTGRDKENDFIRIISGINNRIFINYANNFRYIIHLKQVTESTGTENIIEYNMLYSSTKAIYISSPPGEQSGQPWEGLQLMGGFIAGCGHCIHIESDVNASYMYVEGSIDGGGDGNLDYVNESTLTHAFLVLKYILENNSTFQTGDILINPRLSQLYMKAGGTSPSIYISSGNPTGQAISDMKGIIWIGGVGNVDTKEGLIVGRSFGLTSPDAVSTNLYYDVKDGTAAGEKEGGFQLVYRSNNDASAIAGGKVVIKKEAGSNYCSINFYRNETDLIAKFDVSGHLSQFGGQIAFPATQVPSADPNTLDDYEEEDWTATLTCGTSGTITLNGDYQTGSYTKIGRMVTITGGFIVSAIDAPVGVLYLEGLPFPSSDANKYYAAVSVYATGLAATATTQIMGYIVKNSSRIKISRFTAGDIADMAGDVEVGSQFYVSATYFTD